MKALKAAPTAAITTPIIKPYTAVPSQNLRKSNIIFLPGKPPYGKDRPPLHRLHKSSRSHYIPAVRWNNQSRVIPTPGFIEPCLPTLYHRPPARALWIHEIKHDGYRLLVRKRDGKVRIYTRRGDIQARP